MQTNAKSQTNVPLLLDFDTHDVGLSNSMTQKVFPGNHWCDILNCSCKWLCLSNSYGGAQAQSYVLFCFNYV